MKLKFDEKMYISSAANTRVKSLVKLRERSKVRNEQGLCIVEGERECERALLGGYMPTEWYVPEEGSQLSSEICLKSASEKPVYFLKDEVFNKVSIRGSNAVVLGVFKTGQIENMFAFDDGKAPTVFAFEGIEKPGNLGAIMRSLDGAGINHVSLINSKCDVFNPSCIRSSLGTVFHIQIRQFKELSDWERFVSEGEYLQLRLDPESTVSFFDQSVQDWLKLIERKPLAVVFGAEDSGLTDGMRAKVSSTQNMSVRLPMAGVADSLNLSATVAIMAYHIRRTV